MTRDQIPTVAPLPGLAVCFLLVFGCQFYAETPGERLRLTLTALSLPLSALTTWLVAILLGWNSTDSSEKHLTNKLLSGGPPAEQAHDAGDGPAG